MVLFDLKLIKFQIHFGIKNLYPRSDIRFVCVQFDAKKRPTLISIFTKIYFSKIRSKVLSYEIKFNCTLRKSVGKNVVFLRL